MSTVTPAVDIGGTKIAAAVMHGEKIQAYVSIPTPSQEGPEAVLDAAWMAVTTSLSRMHPALRGRVSRLGVASAGVVDIAAGTITSATTSLPGWAGTRLRAEMERRSGLGVTVLNDVGAHALGEFRLGAGRGHSSMLLVAAGTGIGGGIITDERLVLGRDFAAGHLGHVPSVEAQGLACPCGGEGHVEAIASGAGIEAAFQRATGLDRTGREIARLAGMDAEGSGPAREVLGLAGLALGRMIGGLLNVVNPDLVVLTGSVAQAGPIWREHVALGIRREALPLLLATPVVPGQLANAALMGAGLVTGDPLRGVALPPRP